jgi:N-acetylglucosamine kinase-like BadF-type ATPase
MSGALILGIDGGGSKTLLALADASGRLVRTAAGGGINPMDNKHWRDALVRAVSDFGLEPDRIAGAAVALPAYGEVETVSRALEEVVGELLGSIPRRILNDVDAAHAGAFAGGPGILILSGTGSMAWARDTQGRAFRVGGWGEGFGDEGSAHWIGLRAVSLASQAIDGRIAAPQFTAALFEALGLDAGSPMDSLAGWFAALPHRRSAVAALASLVDRLAEAGDSSAQALLEAAAAELALHLAAIRRIAGADLAWSYAGGAFNSRRLLDLLARRAGTPPRPPVLAPVGGALLAAATNVGWPADAAWTARLAADLASLTMRHTAASPNHQP